MFDKRCIRREMLIKKRQYPLIKRKEDSRSIVEQLDSIAPLHSSFCIMGYLALPHEVNIDEYLQQCIDNGKIVGVPITDTVDKKLHPWRLSDFAEGMTHGTMGIREPSINSSSPIPIESIEAMIVPGVAFDRMGNRLGYGGGYYDRFIAELRKKIPLIGVAFDFQLIDELPVDDYDKKVDIVVTPGNVLRV